MDTSDLPLETWKFMMRVIKEYEGLTYAEISLRTHPQIAASTIEKKLAPGGDGQDVMRETRRAIENAILGASLTRCYRTFMESIPDSKKTSAALEAEMELLRHNIDTIHLSYQRELELVRREAQEKIEYLRAESAEKSQVIKALLEKK